VLYEEDVFDSALAEKLVHKKLNSDRLNPKREFFKLPLKRAVKVVFETCMEVNVEKSKEASTRILIVMSLDIANKNLAQLVTEKLSSHKGGRVGVWILAESKIAKTLIKIGDEWDVSLSPGLVNELKQLKGITSVLWTSSDLTWLKYRHTEKSSWSDADDDDIPF
ncbi:MAG TPA: GIY-YIG nuclease family protein, partial [Nitrososphaeraceae archaeon]